MVMYLIVADSEGSRNLRAANNVQFFTGKFTELSDSELPNSTVNEKTSLQRGKFWVHTWGSLLRSTGDLLC